MSTMDLVSSPLDEYLASAGVVDEDQLESVKASQIFYRVYTKLCVTTAAIE